MTRIDALRRAFGRWSVRRRYRSEIALLAGRAVGAPDRPSAVFHTVERAGSRFAAGVLARLARSEGLVPIDLDSYHYEIGEIGSWIAGERGGDEHAFDAEGCFFGPFRTASPNTLALRHRGVLLIRDPRDVLVSLHHNYGWEPRDPIAGGPEARAAVRAHMDDTRRVGLDDFVVRMAKESHIRDTFEAYGSVLLGAPHIVCLTYEDMVADLRGWLDRVVHHLDWSPRSAAIDRVVAASRFEPRPGAMKGRREVRPGGHTRKLRPETVATLNRELEPLLRVLGYAP